MVSCKFLLKTLKTHLTQIFKVDHKACHKCNILRATTNKTKRVVVKQISEQVTKIYEVAEEIGLIVNYNIKTI